MCREAQLEGLELREPGEGDGARWERGGGQIKQAHHKFECISMSNGKSLKSLNRRVTCSDL